MATAEKLPFSWRDVEGLRDLERLRSVPDTLADEEIVAALEAGRGRGRNDHPVRAVWTPGPARSGRRASRGSAMGSIWSPTPITRSRWRST